MLSLALLTDFHGIVDLYLVDLISPPLMLHNSSLKIGFADLACQPRSLVIGMSNFKVNFGSNCVISCNVGWLCLLHTILKQMV